MDLPFFFKYFILYLLIQPGCQVHYVTDQLRKKKHAVTLTGLEILY